MLAAGFNDIASHGQMAYAAISVSAQMNTTPGERIMQTNVHLVEEHNNTM